MKNNSSEKKVVTIDYGNTNPHVSIVGTYGPELFYPLDEFLKKYEGELDQFIYLVSDVQKGTAKLPQVVKDNVYSIARFKRSDTFLNMKINYAATLGEDRLYQAYYVFNTHSEGTQDILLVDVGTFLTADLIDTTDGFMGGVIAPGPKLVYPSYQKGHDLNPIPYEDIVLEDESYLAHDTDSAIASGMYAMYVGTILLLMEQWRPQKVILTGGISPKLKPLITHMPVEVEVIPHHIHHSLSYIYQETKDQENS
jgi:pantothenate kinase type III